MFPISLLMNPWLLLGAIFLLASSCTTGYVAGRKHEANSWKAEEAEYMKAQAEAMQYRRELEHRLAEQSTIKENEIKALHRRLNNEINKSTSGTSCLGGDAVSVWNRAFDSIRGVSEGSSRVSEGSSVPIDFGATDREVLTAANEVAEILNTCREQINNIREWDRLPHKK